MCSIGKMLLGPSEEFFAAIQQATTGEYSKQDWAGSWTGSAGK